MKEFRFRNPHARIYLDVIRDDGTVEAWVAEGANVTVLRLNGWVGDEIAAGDRITVTGAPARDGSARMEWKEISLADGKKLLGRQQLSPGARRAARAPRAAAWNERTLAPAKRARGVAIDDHRFGHAGSS